LAPLIAIVDYGMGNVGSIRRMLTRVLARPIVTSDPDEIARADKLVLPGVGAFDAGMGRLRRSGLLDVLEQRVLKEEAPVLGICLGMQLLTRSSEEGTVPGLGWVEAETQGFRFHTEMPSLKIPHMGWNDVATGSKDGAGIGIREGSRFYFLHSYHVVCDHEEDVVATTTFGYEFASVFRHRHILGVQFHPEKSLQAGLALFDDFAYRF
jgi:glutamine amidotransferase